MNLGNGLINYFTLGIHVWDGYIYVRLVTLLACTRVEVSHFLEILPRRDFISRSRLVRWQFEGSYISRSVSTEIDMHARTASILGLFTCTNYVHVHTYIAVDPLPRDKISRVVFIGMRWQEICSDISRVAGFRGAARFWENMVYHHRPHRPSITKSGDLGTWKLALVSLELIGTTCKHQK